MCTFDFSLEGNQEKSSENSDDRLAETSKFREKKQSVDERNRLSVR